MSSVSSASSASSASLTAPELGLMRSGPRLTLCTTRGGYRVDEVSSALQKAGFRRSDPDAAAWLALEWMDMVHLRPEKMARAVLSNFRNRVSEIFLFEDALAFAQPWLVRTGLEAFERWEADGRRCDSLGARDVYDFIGTACVCARKCRLDSDVRAQFGSACARSGEDTWSETRLLAAFEAELRSGALSCVRFPFLWLDSAASMRKAWALLKRVASPCAEAREFLELTERLYFKNRERAEKFLYFVHAIYLVIHRDSADIEWQRPALLQAPLPTADAEWAAVVAVHVSRPPELRPPIPDFALCMHTSRGRKLGRGALHFLEHGAVVRPEDARYLVPEWRAEYVRQKREKAAMESASPSQCVSAAKKAAALPVRKRERPPSDNEDVSESESDQESTEEEWRPRSKGGAKPAKRVTIKTAVLTLAPSTAASTGQTLLTSFVSRSARPQGKTDHAAAVRARVPQEALLTLSEIAAARAAGFVAQKVTGKHKQTVLLTPTCVLKGPFVLEKGETARRLVNTLDRHGYWLKLGVRAPATQFLWEEGAAGRALWLKMERVGAPPPEAAADEAGEQWAVKERVAAMVNGEAGAVVARRSAGVENGANITLDEWERHPQAAVDLLLMIALRYVLEPPVGDSGPWNCLVRLSDFAVFAIDYEEEWGVDEAEHGARTSLRTWYAPLSPRAKAWPADRVALFERLLGLGEGDGEPRYAEWGARMREQWRRLRSAIEAPASGIRHSRLRLARVSFLLKA